MGAFAQAGPMQAVFRTGGLARAQREHSQARKPGAEGPVSVMTFWTFCILDLLKFFSRNSSYIFGQSSRQTEKPSEQSVQLDKTNILLSHLLILDKYNLSSWKLSYKYQDCLQIYNNLICRHMYSIVQARCRAYCCCIDAVGFKLATNSLHSQ